MMYHFLINPIAGDKISDEVIQIVEDYAKEHPDFNYQITLTEFRGHGTLLARQITNPHDVIINVGGDGSTFDIINGIKPGVAIGIIPAGTGNDFFKMYGLPKDMSLKQIVYDTIEGNIAKVDCGLVNNKYKYINSLNIGLDVEVLIEFDKKRMRRKFISPNLTYITSALKVFLRKRTYFLRSTIDGKKGPNEISLWTMMNGQYYGGGFKPTPQANIQDGMMDFCYVENIPYSVAAKFFLKYRSGNHEFDPRIVVRKFKNITIEADQPFSFGCDGEVYETNKVEVSIIENGVTLLVPKATNLKQEER